MVVRHGSRGGFAHGKEPFLKAVHILADQEANAGLEAGPGYNSIPKCGTHI